MSGVLVLVGVVTAVLVLWFTVAVWVATVIGRAIRAHAERDDREP